MITIDIKKNGFSFNSKTLSEKLKKFLEKHTEGEIHVDVTIVNDSDMMRLGKKYLKETDGRVHNVLSFPSDEIKEGFVYPPDGVKRIGEVVVSYYKAVEEAEAEGVDTDDRIYQLVEHGCLHLLGVHHEE